MAQMALAHESALAKTLNLNQLLPYLVPSLCWGRAVGPQMGASLALEVMPMVVSWERGANW